MRKRTRRAIAGGAGLAIAAFLLTPVLLLALAGCGTATADAQDKPATCSRLAVVTSEPIVDQCDITLTDTRHVTCIIVGVQKGITCDWAHASGTDKEPGR